jgi:hypothetical protein
LEIGKNENSGIIEKVKKEQKNNNIAKTFSTCNCGTKPGGSSCSTFRNCAKKFMGSADSRSFTIVWNNCTAGCGIVTTTGLVCYTGTCEELNVQFNELPSCLQNCFPIPYCEKGAHIVCQGSTYSIQFISLDGTQTFTIVGDPHVSITCNPTNGTAYSKCEGDLTWN